MRFRRSFEISLAQSLRRSGLASSSCCPPPSILTLSSRLWKIKVSPVTVPRAGSVIRGGAAMRFRSGRIRRLRLYRPTAPRYRAALRWPAPHGRAPSCGPLALGRRHAGMLPGGSNSSFNLVRGRGRRSGFGRHRAQRCRRASPPCARHRNTSGRPRARESRRARLAFAACLDRCWFRWR